MLLAKLFTTLVLAPMLRRLFIIILCVSLQSCTLMLWHNALRGTLESPSIAGYISDDTHNAPPAKYLIVRYTTKADWNRINYYYAISLEDGKQPRFLGYSGSERTANEICDDLSEERLRDAKNYEFPKDSYTLGKSLSDPGKYESPNVVGSKMFTLWDRSIPLGDTGTLLLPYWWTDVYKPKLTEDSPLLNSRLPLGPDYHFDEQTYFLVVPAKQKRSLSEILLSGCGAVVATPFALAADVVLLPFTLLSAPLDHIK